jgi:hypothetical protein
LAFGFAVPQTSLSGTALEHLAHRLKLPSLGKNASLSRVKARRKTFDTVLHS